MPTSTPPDFDEIIDRRGTHSVKWDMMEELFGVPAEGGLAMWVADMDFRPPACVQRALERMAAHGIYGYFGDDGAYLEAIRWWMRTRHGWEVAPEAILSVHGLVNGTALCIDTFTQPGEGVALMSPVYHAFHRVIAAAGRSTTGLRMELADGLYVPAFDDWDAQMTGNERLFLLCSPHNPGGRVWSREELRAIADFCTRHGLILVSDEIHHDLVLPGHRHLPMAVAAPEVAERLVMMTAATKTFNIAGIHTGNVIIPDAGLRARFGARLEALGISANSFGLTLTEAAYSPEGAAWVDALMAYLDGNRQVFDAGIARIPGLRSMPLQATYLAWVDLSATGLDEAEITRRVAGEARIAANAGPPFGAGGERHLRFNLAMPRAQVVEAVARLQHAFRDLQ